MQCQMVDSQVLPLACLLVGQWGWVGLRGPELELGLGLSGQLLVLELGQQQEEELKLRLGQFLSPELLLLQQKPGRCFLGLWARFQREALTVVQVWVQTPYVSVWRALVLGQRLRVVLELQLVGELAEGLLEEEELV